MFKNFHSSSLGELFYFSNIRISPFSKGGLRGISAGARLYLAPDVGKKIKTKGAECNPAPAC